jgi:ribose 1,5-bisphosphokinase
VTKARAIAGHRPGLIGPGRLVLVVGPSGAGKDTLIALARAACCAAADSVVFPRRVVTREPSSFEDNEPLTLEAFRQAQALGEFAIDWEAHGHCYALRRTIGDDIGAGRTVVANVSRTVVAAMRRTYADVVVVAIMAPPEILSRRLAARTRGSDGPVTDRLRRIVDAAAATPDVTIMNVGSAEDHARELLRVIREVAE